MKLAAITLTSLLCLIAFADQTKYSYIGHCTSAYGQTEVTVAYVTRDPSHKVMILNPIGSNPPTYSLRKENGKWKGINGQRQGEVPELDLNSKYKTFTPNTKARGKDAQPIIVNCNFEQSQLN